MQREAEMANESESQPHQEVAPQPVHAPAPSMEEHVREEAPEAEAPRHEAAKVETPRYEAPGVDPKEILSSAGLQMVETDRSKAVQPLPEPEPVQLGRPRREKPAAPAVAESELVQVETRNK